MHFSLVQVVWLRLDIKQLHTWIWLYFENTIYKITIESIMKVMPGANALGYFSGSIAQVLRSRYLAHSFILIPFFHSLHPWLKWMCRMGLDILIVEPEKMIPNNNIRLSPLSLLSYYAFHRDFVNNIFKIFVDVDSFCADSNARTALRSWMTKTCGM